MYEVLLERQAEKDLRALEQGAFDRIILEIRALGEDPRPPGCRKLKGSQRDWRIRVGRHRVLYEVDDRSRVVRVFRDESSKRALLLSAIPGN